MINNSVSSVVPFEHERRFFPDLKQFSLDPLAYEEIFIQQGYLEDELHTRIRRETYESGAHKYLQTRKTGDGISRKEDEIEITKETFESMWRSVEVSLTKSRYLVPLPLSDKVAEVNVFHGALRGYIQIEVEFKTHEEAVAFIPPGWFGKEVTDDKEHGNYHLAKCGCEKLIKD